MIFLEDLNESLRNVENQNHLTCCLLRTLRIQIIDLESVSLNSGQLVNSTKESESENAEAQTQTTPSLVE